MGSDVYCQLGRGTIEGARSVLSILRLAVSSDDDVRALFPTDIEEKQREREKEELREAIISAEYTAAKALEVAESFTIPCTTPPTSSKLLPPEAIPVPVATANLGTDAPDEIQLHLNLFTGPPKTYQEMKISAKAFSSASALAASALRRRHRVTESELNADKIARKPFSVSNEIVAMEALKYLCTTSLERFSTSLEEDVEILIHELDSLSINKKNAIVCRMGEKKVYNHYYDLACCAIQSLSYFDDQTDLVVNFLEIYEKELENALLMEY